MQLLFGGMTMNRSEEEIIFELISISGTARNYLFEAFDNCKKENYEEAKKDLEMAKNELLKAHNIQTSLIQEEAQGNFMEVKLLMVHAQDHLMTTILTKDLIDKMIDMQKEINSLKN